MCKEKFIMCFLTIFPICCFAIWSPIISRQKHIPKNFEEKITKLKKGKKEKEEKKIAFQEHYKFAYLTHQKNRLNNFAEHDRFIWFHDEDNRYTYFLSNEYPTHLKIWDMKFTCAEGAFQAAKFLHKPEIAVRFTHLDSENALMLAQKLSYQQRPDWYQVREKIMLEVLRAKFQQHTELNELLLSTGDAYLVENSNRDIFWSDGGDGSGKNRLGELLMKLREEKGGKGAVSKPLTYTKFHH